MTCGDPACPECGGVGIIFGPKMFRMCTCHEAYIPAWPNPPATGVHANKDKRLRSAKEDTP